MQSILAMRQSSIKRLLKKTILPLYLYCRGLYYKGNKVACPCCNRGFSRFLPAGANRRPVQCPRCRSNERDRALWLYLDRHRELLKPGMRLLHVAPEEIFFKRFRSIEGLEYFPADKFADMFESTYPGETKYLDITGMPEIKDHYFDVIICSHVLEYVKEDNKAMNELFRVLKPGGIAFLQVPIKRGLAITEEDERIVSRQDRITHYGDPGHIRFYGADYERKLQGAGFETKFIPLEYLFNATEIETYRLAYGDHLHVAVRPLLAVEKPLGHSLKTK